ncbi:MAG: filamentous hemagglutinin N-terminal domain-containing protein, partial [Gammaproteobacteria bacterium]
MTLALVAPVTLHSEVILDGSLGPAVALNGPAYVVDADLGQINGSNLFHSFVTFDLSSAESATFTGPGSISNVLGRVTGGSVSNIDGAINMQIPGANLYLVNPSGIVFGPNATLNLSGSFHASTAAAIRLGENGSFDATNSGNSVL